MPSSSSSHSPSSLLLPPFSSRARNPGSMYERQIMVPANSVGPPCCRRHSMANFFFCFFVVFSSHLFAHREMVVLRAYHALVPHHPGATASLHVASHHPSPAATPTASPRCGSTLLPWPWYASPRHITSHPHPILLSRNDALWGPPHSHPHPSRHTSILGHHTTMVRKTCRLATPHRHVTPPRHSAQAQHAVTRTPPLPTHQPCLSYCHHQLP